MPAAIPDRFHLEMRLGRDGDLEEWLATDTSLDRPVLVRSLGPESSERRRAQFVESVGAAAKASHPHLARVFAVGLVEGGAYSVSEWTGGATLADRVAASQPVELSDFLPNAAGLAGALAALHAAGVGHGDIDLSAVSYSAAHAAKLGAFGRIPRTDPAGDVRSLGAALETSLTGAPPEGLPPSERIDGVPRSLDHILRSAQSGHLDAAELEKALMAAPTPRSPRPEASATSRRLVLAAVLLVLLALGLVMVGRMITGGGPPLLPASPAPTTGLATTLPSPTPTPAGQVTVQNVATFDPFGGGRENDHLVSNLTDRDFSTSWRTDSYPGPLAEQKEGVGLTFTLRGRPSRVELFGFSEGTSYEIYWSDTYYAGLDGWDRVATGRTPPGTTTVHLPARDNGFWLIWLTELPLQPDGTYYSAMSQVRFHP